LAVYGSAQLIVGDYTGFDIRPYYPMTQFNMERLKNKVLFDMSYSGGSCFVNLASVPVLRQSNGDFIQPYFTPLLTLKAAGVPPSIIAAEAGSRREALELFVHRFFHVLHGTKEPRHWCTEDHVMNMAERLFYTYGLIPSLIASNLRSLMAEALMDFIAVRGTSMLLADIYALIDSPTSDYGMALRITTPPAENSQKA
jgi:hypothetical protein